MGRILSVDYGKKRCGLAVTDPLQIVPGGLGTVATQSLMGFLRDYTRREEVETIVVGEPLQPNGMASENKERVDAFVGRLRNEFKDIEVVTYDERFTSVLAHRAMIDGGLKKKDRQNKALVDEISATIILEDYMNYRKARTKGGL